MPDGSRLALLAQRGFSETGECPTRQALSAAEIDEMREVVDFQSHTVYHPILPRCTPQRAHDEVAASKRDLEERFGLPIYALAYPNGDYSAREVAAAQAAGYACAVTLDFGFNSRTTPAFKLKRICINDDASVDEAIVKASGVWGLLKAAVRLTQSARAAR